MKSMRMVSDEYDDEETTEKKQAIQAELKIVRHILEMARAIKTNAKIYCVEGSTEIRI